MKAKNTKKLQIHHVERKREVHCDAYYYTTESYNKHISNDNIPDKAYRKVQKTKSEDDNIFEEVNETVIW